MKIVTAMLAVLLAAPAWAGESPAATDALNNLPVDRIAEVPVDLTP